MDVKLIIREMVKNGQSRDDIISSLQELGIANPSQVFDEAVTQVREVDMSQQRQAPQARSPWQQQSTQEPAPFQPSREEEKSQQSYEGGMHSLFEEETNSGAGKAQDDLGKREGRDVLEKSTRPLFGEQKARTDMEEAQDAVDEIPKLEITNVTEGNEKTVDIESMLRTKPARDDVMRGMPQSSMGNLDNVERKLDEAIALLKALQEINKKILDANRDLIMKLK